MKNYTAVRRVLWITMGLNLVATFVKLSVGYWTGALSLIADGFDSVFDAAANVVGLVGIMFAARPADEEHPYGHRKAETLTALIIALLLFLTTWELLKSAVLRLQNPALIEAEVNFWSFASLLVSIIVHIGVSVYELGEGRRLHSDVLVADALHTRADIFVSVAVMGGLAAVSLGYPIADPILALIIAVVIAKIGVDIIRESSPTLMDRRVVPVSRITEIARSVPGVLSCHQVRSRGHEMAVFVDLHIQVDPAISNDEAHAIAHRVQARLREEFSNVADVTVHAEPTETLQLPGKQMVYVDTIQAAAANLGMEAHNLLLYKIDGHFEAEFHVEVDAGLTLKSAHDMVSALESRVKKALPDVVDIIVHIEPLAAVVNMSETDVLEQDILQAVHEVTGEVLDAGACHHMHVRSYASGWAVSMHCTLPQQLPLREAHRTSTRLEQALRQKVPGLEYVVIHTEPEE
ncbi:MAG: cation-efflux pump [Anaerolineae bacterium]|nr:cation-efflux pump [Anaerolineae bacterium]